MSIWEPRILPKALVMCRLLSSLQDIANAAPGSKPGYQLVRLVKFLIYMNVLLCFHRVLSSAGALGAKFICSEIPGLNPHQRVICQNHPKAIAAMGEGAKIGLLECQSQFRGMRWNCSSSLASKSLFGHYHVHGELKLA